MYKDVKKKLLSVALCICMVIGMVQVVPKVKAADTPQLIQTVQATQVGDSTNKVTATFTIELDWCSTIYNGENQQPTIKRWEGIVDSTGDKFSGSSDDIAGLIETASSNAGSYSCGIKSQRWNFPADSIKYEITKARFDTLRAEIKRAATVQYYNAQNRVPDEDQIEVTAYVEDERIIINPSQYIVSPETNGNCGEQTCAIEVKSANYESQEWSVGGLKYAIAYNMGDKSNCQVTIDPTDIPYGSTVTPPTITLRTEQTGDVTVTEKYFKTTYYKNGQVVTNLNSAGTYTVTVEPKGRMYSLVDDDQTKCFAGKYEGTFNVTYEGTDRLRVFAKDPNDPNGQEKELSRESGSNLIMRYNQGKPVEPTITKILTPDGEDIFAYCTIDFPDSTKIGKTEIKITPDPTKTNYKDPFSVYYRITSGLNIKTFKFQGADFGKTEIAYDGDIHKLETCVVTDEIGDRTLLNGSDYHIQYQYWKEDEGRYVDATDEQLKDRGKKCALIVGQGVYQGNEYPLEYEITPIDLSQGGVTVTFAEDRIPYTGEPIKPVITSIQYKGMPIDQADWESEFEFIYVNNIDAGVATLKLRGKEDNYANEYEYLFTITKLDLSKATADPLQYEYTGSPIVPAMKIGSYKLEPTDYEIQSFDQKAGQTVAPVDVRSHTVEIVSRNPNIDGSTACSVDYEIIKHTIKATEVHLTDVIWDNDVPTIEWNGGVTRPGVVVGSESCVVNRDYKVSFENDSQISTDAGLAVAIVTGLAPNYTGEVRVSYKIVPRRLSNEGVKAQMPNVSGAPDYTITATLTDTPSDGGTKPLQSDTHYTVKEVWYWDGVPRADESDDEWKLLTSSTDYQISNDNGNATISNLKKAGNYRVVFEGKGDYTGTRTENVKCGTDISTYWAHINGGPLKFPYDGQPHTPADFILYNGDAPVNNIQYDGGNGGFSVEYERDGDAFNITESVGKIYVIAIGNTEKGCFGKTNRADRPYGYYEIVPPKWTEDKIKIAVKDVDYEPYEKTEKPNPIVTFSGITLKEDEDYILEYDADYYQADQHFITVKGIGNHIGQQKTCSYWVHPVAVSDKQKIVCKIVTDASYNDISKGKFILRHGTYELQEGTKDEPKDYRKYLVNNGAIKDDPQDPNKHYIEYRVEGKGNYTGEDIIQVPINTVDFKDVTWAESKDTAKLGDFYVEWKDSELLITDPEVEETLRKQVKPENFTILYKQSDTGKITDWYRLKRNTDYTFEDTDYGLNRTAGESLDNTVTIHGMGGYTGECTFTLTLYSAIDKAQTTQESLITPGAIIKKSQWKKIYDQYGEKGLLKLQGLSFDEQKGISQEEYDLNWPSDFDVANPIAGTYTVTVSGAHKPTHYYHGNVSFTFEIRDDIEGAQIVVGDHDTMTYKGKDQEVTLTANDITVTVDGVRLIFGTDYKILGYTNNTEIGQATVHLQGIGKYEGDVIHPFQITYPISKLIVFVQDPNRDWQNTLKGPVEYSYTGRPIEPAVKLYCPADFDANAGDDVYLAATPLSTGLYEVEYLNNTDAGDATIVIKSQSFTDGSPDPRLHVTFKIGAGAIAPPKVTYTSTKGYNLKNLRVPYMGELYEVDDDLGIELADGSLTLKEDEHYKVWFEGDRKNVTDPKNGPTKIHFDGLNNYAGSTYAIPMTIECRKVTDQEVEAPQVLFTYMDNVREQNLLDAIKLTLKTPRNRKQPLVYGTDFMIEGYYMDAGFVNEVPLAKGVNENGRVIPKVPGSYYARVVGKGNFTGERAVSIEIEKRNLTDNIRIEFVSSQNSECIVVDGMPDCTYNGKEHHPAIQVTYGIDAIRLVEGRDYEVSYGPNVDAGEETASVTVKMIDNSNYEGEATRFFTIKSKDIADEDMQYLDKNGDPYADEREYEWTKQQVRPTNFGKVYDISRREDLIAGTDYTIDYHDDNEDNSEQRNAGKVEMIFSGSGNYTGKKVFTYYIGEDISRAYTLVNGKRSLSVEYNGMVQAPKEGDISVEIAGSDKLDLIAADGTKRYAIKYFKDGFEYENRIAAEDITDAGTYYIAVVGVPELGTYAKSSEENTCIYTITPRNIGPSYILVSGYEGAYYYTGQAIEPKGLTVEDTDLPVSNEGNDPQRRSVKLINGKDYTVSYANNISAGKASIIVTGKGNYGGTRTAYFNILSSDTDGNNTWNGSSEGTGSISNGTTTISASDIILGYDNSTYDCMMYNGYERIPTISINGINANEFTVTASNNIRPGVATLTITGRGNNYTGTILKNFNIKADLSRYGKIASIEDQVYTGYQITPQVTLTCGGNLLNQGSDYTVTYMNNTGIGRATVTATATNDSYYIGSATGSFNISNTAGGMEITGYASSYTYTGYAITPDVAVTMNGRLLNRGTDYVVSYYNNVNVGTATMTVTGMGSFSGTKTINYTIEAKNIENCLTTTVTNYKYTGNTYTPSVTVTDSSTGKTLVAGTDYTIVYSNNTNPGTASITVTALSKNYTGSKVIPFKITSAAVSGLRVSSIKNSSLKLSWSSQDYADGYQICNSKNRVIATTSKNSYTVKGLNSCTTYKYKVRSYVENTDGSRSYGSFSTAVSAKTRLNTPKLKAVSTSKGKVTLTWTKVSKATGYEIYYSTKKNGLYTRLKTISKSSSRKYVDSGLASGEKYYYTIRAYRTTNGVKTYSSYNTIKAVRVK